ncbi:VAN3-binding protein [Malania oleifera]|uniref:VAN3-binding protein n=1 Tax=Malania oleifera TaxID=397392 RepID=UPI0025AE70B3|nr:VAN3-binding protein [Malania oleifera]
MVACMDSNFQPTVSEAHPETMDFLSSAWCNFAVQAFQPELQDHASIVLHGSPIKKFENDSQPPFPEVEKNVKIDDADLKSLPPWKSNDVKSWIWMQQAMHPELNYNSCFRKKWVPWPFRGTVSIKKWLKEVKQKRKQEERVQRAEVHAAISVAGVAAALAAVAAENSKHDESNTTKESAVASAAALVAAQCAQVAEAMGAKRHQLSAIISSAMTGTAASDILTLTAAATTSMKGAATLKVRTGCKNRLNGTAPVLPIEDNNELQSDFENCKLLLAMGAELRIETPDGKCTARSVSVILNSQAKVILITKKLGLLNAFGSKKESTVLDLHAELCNNSEMEENNTCYLLVLTTSRGIVKLDMKDDHRRYKMWASTINHLLMLSTSFVRYELQLREN